MALVTLLGCERTGIAAGASVSPSAPASQGQVAAGARDFPEPAEVPEFGPEVWDGVCLAHSWEDRGAKGYGTEASAEALDHLATIGVGWVSLTPFGFMESLSTPRVDGEHVDAAALPAGAERADRVVEVARQARARGIQAVLKPHLWVRGGKWRGHIKPVDESGAIDWDAWWASYEAFIVYWARVARRAEIPSFVVGVELYSALQADTPRFLEVIAAVRQVYDGEVHYAANWNEPVTDPVWRALDAVGVQFYPPLAETFEADPAALRAMMREHLDAWSEVAVRNDRPLILTEVGYRAAVSAASHPNAWPERTNGKYAVPDPELQRGLYALLFRELASTPRFKGVFLWKYFTNKDTDEEGEAGFSPRGRPAEEMVSRAFEAR